MRSRRREGGREGWAREMACKHLTPPSHLKMEKPVWREKGGLVRLILRPDLTGCTQRPRKDPTWKLPQVLPGGVAARQSGGGGRVYSGTHERV